MKPSFEPPPWEVLVLVSRFLDPKTLSIASCVCKTWSASLSSDHIWKPICFTHYPSFSHLHLSHPTLSYRHLYILAHLSSRSRVRLPSPPTISLNDLMFCIDVFTCDSHVLTLVKSGEDLVNNGVFRFDIDVCGNDMGMVKNCDEMRVTWTMVLKGWKGVFLVMDCKGKGRLVAGGERWFSEELPSPGCCTSTAAVGGSGLVAELGLGLCGGDKLKVEKASMGMLRVLSWRYLGVDDGLRYLQHFLLPSKV